MLIIFFAIIQGITEFLPISSSAHLIILRDLFGIGENIINKDLSLTFDIALHFGTLLAIIVTYHKDLMGIARYGLKRNEERRIIYNIIVATIPAAIIGVIFEDIIDNYIRNKYIIIAFSLIAVGIIMYIVDKNKKESKNIYDITIIDSLMIGLCQIFALVPGFSRSGTTITAARELSIEKEASTKFSFFLSIPIIFGAMLLQLIKIDLNVIIDNVQIFIVAIVVSFIVGMLSINFLVSYLKKNNFKIFMIYRLVFGLFIIFYSLLNG